MFPIPSNEALIATLASVNWQTVLQKMRESGLPLVQLPIPGKYWFVAGPKDVDLQELASLTYLQVQKLYSPIAPNTVTALIKRGLVKPSAPGVDTVFVLAEHPMPAEPSEQRVEDELTSEMLLLTAGLVFCWWHADEISSTQEGVQNFGKIVADLRTHPLWRDGSHSGDCTSQSHPCLRCAVEGYVKEAKQLLPAPLSMTTDERSANRA